MHLPRRPLSALGALVLLTTILPFTAAPVLADSPASVPAGFADEPLFTGLNHPMSVVFAPNGNVFVAEKRGVILFYSSVSDTTPTVFADLNQNVHNFWDRGLMGLAVDPGYPAQPYIYILYSYNHILGDPNPAPRWPSADALVPPGSKYDDRCTNPPAATTDGCVISGRLSRLTASGGVMSGSEKVLIEDWCQQFPSHSQGSLMFGPEGALYATSGDGASFNDADYGQHGGTLPNTPTPENPCGDPGGSNPTPPSAQGGALRSQDLRTSGDPVSLDGSVIRVKPDTGAAWSTNANIGNSDLNARRIIAYGLRNPFRFTIKPGSDDVWVGDVGYNTWEEVNTLSDPNAAPKDFGWPCYEGDAALAAYAGLGLSICDNLNPSDVTMPFYKYNHSASVVSGDGCSTGSSSTSGLAFMSSSSGYPNSYDGALFMTDYSRKCIWYFPSSGGQPTASPVKFANLNRASASDTDGGAVFLTTGPTGDLVYADYDRGEIRQIHYYGANVPPVASFTATPSSGAAPLAVSFNASGSTDANHDALTYAWDLDGDGQYDDATGVTASRTYSSGDVVVGLQVKDPPGLTGTTTRTVSAGNTPPTVNIDTPSPTLTFKVGDVISFSGSSTDQQDGPLPPSAYQWTLVIRHCPSDCHSHIVQTYTGLKSGTIDAPDHEYPSHLQLSVTVTDSGGLTATKMIELFPKTSTVAATTSPAGIPITVGPNTGAPPPAVTEIQNSHVTVSAPASAIIGEGTWTFQHWSDLGNPPRTYSVPVGATPKTVIATYALTSTADRSNTCAGAPAPTSPSGLWQSGRFGSTNDADWYRFKVTATTRVHLVLGNLPVAGRMDLYKGCSTLLQTSDHGGTATEEIIRSLPAGSYAVRLSGSGTSATPDYAFRIKTIQKGVHVLSSRTRVDGGVLRLVGEVYNNSSKSVGPVVVTAKLYNASNHLLATRSARVDLSYLPANGRSSFLVSGSLPAGFNHWTYGITAPVTHNRIGAPTRTITSNGPNGSGHWAVAGSARNGYSTRVTSLRMAITLYDTLGNVLDVRRASVGRTSLAHGASTAFSATFIPTGLAPDRVYVRGMVIR